MSILGFQDKYRFLSNFWPAPVQLGLYSYPTAEHAYQATKAKYAADRTTIAALSTPGKAKRFGRNIEIHPDFDKLASMREVVSAKFTQNHELAELLLATGDEDLIELNTWGDTFWGKVERRGELVGENHLGIILMEVRDKLRGE